MDYEDSQMKIKRIAILLLATLALSLPAADSTNRLHFPVSGFSIAPLEAPLGEKPSQSLMIFLPVTGKLAANVNVQIQPYSGSIVDYTTLSLKQFEDAGLKVIEQKKAGKSGAVFEYTGEMERRALHWYARAEKKEG